MHYDALKTFITLVEVKNFTKTADILHMSQPSVSLHIKNLENDFQTKLLVRSPKLLQITPTGEILYERAKQILTLYEQTKQEILEQQNTIKGTLKIGASFTIGEYVLPSLLFDLQKDFPQLELEVVIGNTNEIVQMVKLLQVDIGLIEGQTNEKELSVHPFMQDTLFIVAASDHPLVYMDGVTMADLQNQEWVTREVGSGTREFFNHIIRANGLKIKSILTISSNQGIKESVINGMGLSLLSSRVIERDLQQKNLSIIFLKNHTFNRTFSYVYSPVMGSTKNVTAFLEALYKKWPKSNNNGKSKN